MFRLVSLTLLRTCGAVRKVPRRDRLEEGGEASHLTCGRDDHLGPAAGEAVQQRLGPDVEVEQGRRAAQLGQGEPGPDEARLVAQEQGHRVALLQPSLSLQRPRHLVAPPVHLAVRVLETLEAHERLVGMPAHRLQKLVHDAVEVLQPLVQVEPAAEPDAPQDVRAVLSQVGEKFPDEGQRQRGQAGEEREPHVHVGARGICQRAPKVREGAADDGY